MSAVVSHVDELASTAARRQRRAEALQQEVVGVIRSAGRPVGMCALEDKCNLWRSPDELRRAVAALIVAGTVRPILIPLRPSGSMLVYGLVS